MQGDPSVYGGRSLVERSPESVRIKETPGSYILDVVVLTFAVCSSESLKVYRTSMTET